MGIKKINYEPGQQIGALTFIEEIEPYINPITKRKLRLGTFECSCGVKFNARLSKIHTGITTRCFSCGKKAGGLSQIKHGHARWVEKDSKAYYTWSSTKRRCNKENDKSYHNYGGRGITMCDFWSDSFENFLAWWQLQDLCNDSKASIDRINNDGSYSPDNCRLVDRATQARNRRNNIWLTNGSRVLCMEDVAAIVGVGQSTIRYHLRKHGAATPYSGWSFVPKNKESISND